MKLTPQQDKILRFAQANGNRITSKQAQENFSERYYMNTDAHLGAILSRMVKAGLLTREKRGVFTVGNGGPEKRSLEKPIPGELPLFE